MSAALEHIQYQKACWKIRLTFFIAIFFSLARSSRFFVFTRFHCLLSHDLPCYTIFFSRSLIIVNFRHQQIPVSVFALILCVILQSLNFFVSRRFFMNTFQLFTVFIFTLILYTSCRLLAPHSCVQMYEPNHYMLAYISLNFFIGGSMYPYTFLRSFSQFVSFISSNGDIHNRPWLQQPYTKVLLWQGTKGSLSINKLFMYILAFLCKLYILYFITAATTQRCTTDQTYTTFLIFMYLDAGHKATTDKQLREFFAFLQCFPQFLSSITAATKERYTHKRSNP